LTISSDMGPGDTARLLQQLRALREIGLVLESTMSLDEVLTTVVERMSKLMDAERATLFLLDESGFLVSRAIDGDDIVEIRLASGQGIAGWVALHGSTLLVPDAYADERFDPTWDKKSGFHTLCVICCPIRSNAGTVIGVIEILNKNNGGQFSSADIELAGLLAGQLTLTIENSRLMVDLVQKNQALIKVKQGLHRRVAEVNLLLDLERRVAEADDLESLFLSILSRTREAIVAQIAILYRIDESGAEMRVVDQELPIARVLRVSVGTGFAGWVAAKGKELSLEAPTADSRFTAQLEQRIGVGLENLAAVPLQASEDEPVIGALLVANKGIGDEFDESDMALLRLIAARLALAMTHLSGREERERERRLATVGRLMAGVLHDLKSPISIISGYAELLAEKIKDPEGDEYFDHLNKAVQRISKMAEEIIAFSRGEREILVSNVSLDEFLASFVKQLKPILEKNRVKLITHFRTSGIVWLDADKMIRAFHNIVNNAVEAMDEGGRLILEVDQIDESIVFGFTDTGAGIPEEIQGAVFQSFVTLGKGQGTGLGLAVAREVVDAHNGSISFSTVSGEGTTFLVSIPVSRSSG
jgi:signal transduction histidine kinase/putative methionine-R-sulfoxide reductase with GAF domain